MIISHVVFVNNKINNIHNQILWKVHNDEDYSSEVQLVFVQCSQANESEDTIAENPMPKWLINSLQSKQSNGQFDGTSGDYLESFLDVLGVWELRQS